MATLKPTKSKLIIKRNGKTTTSLLPLPTAIIDTRERKPFSFVNYPNWIGDTKVQTMPTGDYSISGFEDSIILERKTLNDIVRSLMESRPRFLREMERLSSVKNKCLCIEASRTDIKSPYRYAGSIKAHPNAITGSLDAISAKYGIMVVYADNRELAEEFSASWLNKCYAYEWLEKNGYGRILQEGDL